MKYLLTGGSGLLGRYLQKYISCDAPSHKEMDITNLSTIQGEYDVVIHCAAYTNVVKAEEEKEECFKVNVIGTQNLLRSFPHSRFVFLSSEYAYNPVNFYSYTKVAAERLVKEHDNHLIIRTSFIPRPFPHKVAFFDQYTKGDYVDVIAPLIVTAILGESHGSMDIGTERKTMFALARQTKPNILATTVKDINVPLPSDYLT